MIRKLVTLVLLISVAPFVVAGNVNAPKPVHVVPRNHGFSVVGVITEVNPRTRVFVVRNAAGKSTTLVRTGATKVTGGVLAPGRQAEIRWLAKDGKKIATSVKLLPPAAKAGIAP